MTASPGGRARLLAAAKNLGALGLGCVAALGLLEVALQWRNPFQTRVRADRIVLPVRSRHVFVGAFGGGAADTVLHTTNSLGFRGPEPPPDGLFGRLSIIAIGGSTTEGFYLSDGRTWPERLQQRLAGEFRDVWVNNAGLDGHSTVGHLVLLRDYVAKLKPEVALFLVGANEIDYRSEHVAHEIRGGLRFASLEALLKSAGAYSEVASLALNFYRYGRARTIGLTHRRIDVTRLEQLAYPEATLADSLEKYRRGLLPGYEERLRQLVVLARREGIDPVLITQPALFGAGRDDLTGVDLAGVAVGNHVGHTLWRVLELYNDATRKVAAAEGVLLIDLAAALPKSSHNFYDFWHFNEAGAARVADIVGAYLTDYVRQRYPGFAISRP